MPRRRSKLEKFQDGLSALHDSIPEDLRLPSLAVNPLEGFAALFLLVVPLLSAEGLPVFTDPTLQELFRALDRRFGGCLVASSSSHPPYWGLWHPSPSQAEAEKDYLTTIQIFANPIEPSTRFFSGLKQLLKTAGGIEQQEILISRFDCWLM
jgi:hypothetical protein